ncbi:MAG: hypothetical protein K1060chlam5_01003 [Candidatus Anoxychlamydiales bacterium]|nr:hypothetical protein [Candidatus Anoxychlamydiales bacterium]
MPDFSELFMQSKGNPIVYKNKTIVMTDYFPFKEGEQLKIKIEKTSSEWKQGVGIYLFGTIEIENIKEKVKDRTFFFENTAPKEIIITLRSEKERQQHSKKLPKKNILGIKNIWDTGDGVIQSWHFGAAMIVEEIENGRRYYCNDGHPDENFDDIVFTVTKLK